MQAHSPRRRNANSGAAGTWGGETEVQVLVHAARWLAGINSTLLKIGRQISVALLGLMVAIILIQVFFRYVLNNALPWPDEAARFLMLWMTGLMAPMAYRRGGFVAIEMVVDMLPRSIGAILSLVLLFLAAMVLVVGVQLGLKHVASGWLFNSSSLKIPLDWFGMKTIRIKLAWMYMSLLVGVGLLLLVNVELILRSILNFTGRSGELPEIADAGTVGAE